MRLLASLLAAATALAACSADGLLWEPSSSNASPLFRIIIRERAGFIDATGHIVIPPTLEVGSNWSQAFYDGLLSLGASDGPFLNTRGKKVLTNGYDRIWNFSEGLAVARETSKSPWGYIDASGKFVITPRFPTYPEGLVSGFSGGLAAVESAGKLGYIDRTGAFVIPRQFVAGTGFHDGFARVVREGPCWYSNYESRDPCSRMQSSTAPATGPNKTTATLGTPRCRWSFIDKSGNTALPGEFDAALPFHEGLAGVLIGDRWGFIDKQGRMVIPPRFTAVRSFSDGLALVESDEQSGFIDQQGALRISLPAGSAEPFSSGLAPVRRGNIYVFLNTQGNKAFPEEFALATGFFHGLAHVKLKGGPPRVWSGTYAYIDRTGKHVFTYRR